MSTLQCDMERQVESALRSGDVSQQLRDHAANCPVCSDLLLVADFLQTQATVAAADERPLPDPGYIWWRARLQARQDASKRATRSISIVQRISWIAGAAMIVLGGTWVWPSLRSWLAALVPRSLPTPSAPGWVDPGPVLLISVGAIGFLVLLELFGRWVEEG
jgi:hypothetical protein